MRVGVVHLMIGLSLLEQQPKLRLFRLCQWLRFTGQRIEALLRDGRIQASKNSPELRFELWRVRFRGGFEHGRRLGSEAGKMSAHWVLAELLE